MLADRHRVRSALAAALCAGLLAAASPAQGRVHVVDDDGGPGVDFTSVVTAVHAASSGDILLIKAGTYGQTTTPGASSHVDVDGKSLALIAEDGEAVRFDTLDVFVRNLAADRHVVLRGIEGVTSFWLLENNAGAVWIEDVALRNGGAFDSLHFSARLEATGCAAVSLHRCDVEGSEGFFEATGREALRTSGSGVHVYDSALRGGFDSGLFGPGPPAIVQQDGFVFLSGSSVSGGPPGGFAASLSGTSPALVHLDTAFAGAFDVQAGAVSSIPLTARSFRADATVREGQTLTTTFDGVAGDVLILEAAGATEALHLPALNGTYLLPLPIAPQFFPGVLPATGTLDALFPALTLTPGLEGVVAFAQGAALGSDGVPVLAGGSAVLFLDASL